MASFGTNTLIPYLVAGLDWLGTLAFALSGALLGVRKQFDLFGVLFLSFVVAVAGGLIRDLMIGAIPPAAITEIHYFLIAMFAGAFTFFAYPRVASLQHQILLFDAVGLALFAVIGTQKAIEHGVNFLMAALLGMMSGIGGGMMRDVLAGETPSVLRSDLYALAALAGSMVVSAGYALRISPVYSLVLGAALCIFLRLMAIYRGWRLPVAKGNSR